MELTRDYYNNIESPKFLLCKASDEILGEIPCIEKKELKVDELNEINFITYRYINNELNPVYDLITEMQNIIIPGKYRFVVVSVQEENNGINPSKTVNAKSIEYNLGQRYLEEFYINTGEDYGIDGVSLYNANDPTHSLLNIVLQEKCPEWSIGHVDSSIANNQRYFEVDKTDIYTFLTDNMSNAFEAIVTFDSYNMTINVYDENNYGSDTNIFITFDRLLQNTSATSSIDDIKTCMSVYGEDDIDFREVNMGLDRIYNFDYYATEEYMSSSLVSAYNTWKNKFQTNRSTYSSYVTDCINLYNQINYLTNEKMPPSLESTDWTLYGLVPLQEKLAIYQGNQAVMIKAGQAEITNPDYATMYLPVFNAINAINAQIVIVQGQISALNDQLDSVHNSMQLIANDCSLENNFTEAQMLELNKFIREENINSENFVVTDEMTDAERVEMLNEMLSYAEKELQKVSQPQIQFEATITNLFNMNEFDDISMSFDRGNFIHIILRDDYIVKAKLLSLVIDFEDLSKLSVTFGTLNKIVGKTIFTDISKAINASTSVSTTVNVRSSSWNAANVNVNMINSVLENGYISAGKTIQTSSADVQIDDRGIIISSTDQTYPNDMIMIGGSRILFSDDKLRSVREAIGRVKYTTLDGVNHDDFGVLADFVLAGYINGTLMEGNRLIVGGESDGSIIMYDANGVEKGRWDVDGLTLPPGTTISWNNVTNQPTIPTDTNQLTNGAGYTTSIDVSGIITNTVTANYIKTLNLEVGNQISMGANATISWSNVTNQPTIPSKTSQLTNDSSFATTSQIPSKTSQLTNDSDFTTSTAVANTYVTNTALPTKTRELLTEDGYALITQIPTDLNQLANSPGFTTQIDAQNIVTGTVTAAYIATLGLTVGNQIAMGPNATISWSNVTNQPTIPSKTSQLTNDSSFATTSQIPTNNNQLMNGAGYTTSIDVNGIITNTVNASFVNALNVVAGSVAAENITGTTITGKDIQINAGTNKGLKINYSNNSSINYLRITTDGIKNNYSYEEWSENLQERYDYYINTTIAKDDNILQIEKKIDKYIRDSSGHMTMETSSTYIPLVINSNGEIISSNNNSSLSTKISNGGIRINGNMGTMYLNNGQLVSYNTNSDLLFQFTQLITGENSVSGVLASGSNKNFLIGEVEGNAIRPYYTLNNNQYQSYYPNYRHIFWGNTGFVDGSLTIERGDLSVESGDLSVTGGVKAYDFSLYNMLKFGITNNSIPTIDLSNMSNGFRILEHVSDVLFRFVYEYDKTNYANILYGDVICDSNLTVNGTKNRAVQTQHYGTVKLNSFETPEAYFGDFGSAKILNNNQITIFFDPIFAETINIYSEYQIFITKTSNNNFYYIEKHVGYFTVYGDNGLEFDWMINCKQKDYTSIRFDAFDFVKSKDIK